MAEIVAEKVFEHYLEFPEDVRMVVINEMEPDDRCRFTRSSSSCQREARKCKNYINELKFFVFSPIRIVFHAVFNKKNKNSSYSVYFLSGRNGNKYIIYTNHCGFAMWKTQLDRSTNLVQYAYEYVKDMLNKHQKTIKMLSLEGIENYDFGINSLNNLESLKLDDQTDLRSFISKIRKPLKELVCESPISEEILEDYEQIYDVQDWFRVSKTRLNYEQFQKLSARRIHIKFGVMTEENISDFITSWQNDEIRDSFQYCQWRILNTSFDIQKLFQLLRIDHDFEERDWLRLGNSMPKTKVEIRHKKDATKKAEIVFDFFVFKFHVLNQ